MNFQCRICNYKFESHNFPKRCPYCSREGTARPVPEAADLLSEIEKEEKNKEEKKEN